MARSGEAARTALLDAAERLFAEGGVSGVSLRDVSAAAGQRNHSATQYHFGDREGLVRAVFERRMTVINSRRHALMAEYDAAGRGRDLDAIVDVGARPVAEYVCSHEGWYGRFMVRTRTDPLAKRAIRGTGLRSALHINTRRLHDALDALPAAIRTERVEQFHDLVVMSLARWEWQRDRGARTLAPALVIDQLTSGGLALLAAPTRHLTCHTTTNTDHTTNIEPGEP